MAERPGDENELVLVKSLRDFELHLTKAPNHFTDTDKYHFFEVCGLDSSTVVVLCQVIVTHNNDTLPQADYLIARNESGERHAEIVAIDKIKELESVQNVLASPGEGSKIQLIAMSTYSPYKTVQQCQDKIKKMLLEWKALGISVEYTLRIAGLYDDGRKKPDDKAIRDLQRWKRELVAAGMIEIEPIEVCKELSPDQIRDLKCDSCQRSGAPPQENCPDCEKKKRKCLDKRCKQDENIVEQVKKINQKTLPDFQGYTYKKVLGDRDSDVSNEQN